MSGQSIIGLAGILGLAAALLLGIFEGSRDVDAAVRTSRLETATFALG